MHLNRLHHGEGAKELIKGQKTVRRQFKTVKIHSSLQDAILALEVKRDAMNEVIETLKAML